MRRAWDLFEEMPKIEEWMKAEAPATTPGGE